MNADDIDDWCDEHCPDLYNEGMFDDEATADEVWDLVTDTLRETVLDFVDDEDERDEIHDAVLEVARDWFSTHHETVIEALAPATDATIQHLVNKPQVAQHSADWYNQRRNRLTASEFAQILDGRRGALLRSKTGSDPGDRVTAAPVAIAQPDGELPATYWGHRFEPVTRDIYELELAGVGTVNDTLGRFTHPTVPWLSASPDGLVVRGPLTGRLVEIKSPKSRQPGEFVPGDYYAQMQVQMEVCDLDAVDFVEAQFTQVPLEFGGYRALVYDISGEDVSPRDNRRDLTTEEAAACTAARWKGRVEVYGRIEDSNTWIYRYTAPAEDLTEAAFTTPAPVGLPLLEHSVWWLTGWFSRTVLRNTVWWRAIGWPNAELFWTEVESVRAAGTNCDIIQHIEPDEEVITWRT